MRFAYADPPYLGLSSFYGDDLTYDDPQAHRDLVARLSADYDAWAISLHVPSLRVILPMCPDDCRIGAWVKPYASFKPGVNPAYAWEPVIFRGARSWKDRGGKKAATVRDWCAAPITLQRGFVGAKPEAFCFWLFALLGARHDDEFTDLFPGSGAVMRAWENYRRQRRLIA